MKINSIHRIMFSLSKKILLVFAFLLILPSVAMAREQELVTLDFWNYTGTPLTVSWDAHKYNVGAPWQPTEEYPKGSFTLQNSDRIFFYADLGADYVLWGGGKIDLRIDTRYGPILIQFSNSPFHIPLPTVVSGDVKITRFGLRVVAYQIEIHPQR